jgi:transaldolase / glucose-6-phosphate isomerase
VTGKNPLLEVNDFGQSLWYDYIRRGLIESGELKRLIDEDGLRGVTSNPSIFEKAISGSTDYVASVAKVADLAHLTPGDLYEELAIKDIQDAADILRPVYDRLDRGDGYVSLEVSPELASDTEGTQSEAERLWQRVDRENLMIKVPGTPAGIPAIRHLIGRGINVNITLLFSQTTYEQVAKAYIAGLQDFAARGGDVSRVASVASFFVSRIDAAADERLKASNDPRADGLRGKVAIANAKLAYERFGRLFSGRVWDELSANGAQTQRLLWASTSTKDPSLRDVLYVEELIGPDTVDTVPPATFDAFRDHGKPRESLTEGLEEARATLETLADVGIDLDALTARLVDDGVAKFTDAFGKLFAAVDALRITALEPAPGTVDLALPDELRSEVDATVAAWGKHGNVRRLWCADASLWTGKDEGAWLGWLSVADDQLHHPQELERIAADVRAAGFSHAVLLGMGGSSLFPELLSLTFGAAEGHPELHVLDSTDPAQVRAVEDAVDLSDTLFIVSSKSGSTLEPNIFKQYFLARVEEAVGPEEAPKRFVAVTDPGSSLEQDATAAGFRHVAHGLRSIGGRYSALSNFGMVPGAVLGLDVHELLDRAERMAHACATEVPAADNPGLVLGAILGVAANHGRDKLTLVTSPGIGDLGAWLEQLVAESTGKEGKGIVPVDREPLGEPALYGADRLFAYVRLDPEPDAAQDTAVEALKQAGHPVVTISLADRLDIGGEVFRWEFATAVAGAIIGIDPFDQPDVEASKIATRKLTSEYEKQGSLPEETPFARGENVALYGSADGLGDDAAAAIAAHLAKATDGDYVALLFYGQRTEERQAQLTELRTGIRDARHVATCVGFGPRFLHSTGQAYKGGPNTGVFLQITHDDAADLDVPGQRFTFGVVKAAQARGDFSVLEERGRRALRIHLGPDVEAGYAELVNAIEKG